MIGKVGIIKVNFLAWPGYQEITGALASGCIALGIITVEIIVAIKAREKADGERNYYDGTD